MWFLVRLLVYTSIFVTNSFDWLDNKKSAVLFILSLRHKTPFSSGVVGFATQANLYLKLFRNEGTSELFKSDFEWLQVTIIVL